MDEKAYAETLAHLRTAVADDRLTPAPIDAAPALERGQLLGRYLVLERLGAGGMGVVYAAFDPALDRKVAIKILGRSGDDEAGSLAAARLLREAKALARLAHPNVVAVHEAGDVDGRVYVAMEFVPGVTLRQHLTGPPRPWREILKLYVAAGRGLQAAHAAGLVHRDFKPDNVLVGEDGRVRVLDFGLARASELIGEDPDGQVQKDMLRSTAGLDLEAARSLTSAPLVEGALVSVDSRLTRVGALVGTPAYMAPEQFMGAAVDARSDQFSLCVALWEALHGCHPFGEGGAMALLQAISRGKLRQVPKDRRTPTWLQRALARGLRLDPQARWPDLGALLDLLERRARRARKARLAGGVGLTFGLVLGACLWGYARADSEAAACRGAALHLQGAWDPARRADVHAALAGDGRAHARASADRVVAALDARAVAWAATYEDACRATHERREQSAALLDLRMACLRERRDELVALTDLFLQSGPDVVDRAVQAAAALPSVRRCSDPAALGAPAPPPDDPDARAQIDALRRRLAEARALLDAGRLSDGRALAEDVAAAAARVGYAPLDAEAAYILGLLQNRTGDPRAAGDSLRRAALAATAGKLDELAARAMVELIASLGVYQTHTDDALRWSEIAEAMVFRLGPDGHVLEAKRLGHTGIVRQIRGEFAAARELHERALSLLDRPDQPDVPALIGTLSNLGNTLADLGLPSDAEISQRRAVDLAGEFFGPDHPQTAVLLNNLAATLADRGRVDEAAALHVQALAIKERALGPDHLSVGASLRNIAELRLRQGARDEAHTLLRRALAIRERTLGADHPELADLLHDLGEIARQERRFPAAQALFRRALEIAGVAGDDHPRLLPMLLGIGRTSLDAGEPAAALPPLRKALAIEARAETPTRPSLSAFLRLALATALWPTPAARPEARALVLEARARVGEGDSHAGLRRELDTWLMEHPL